MSTGATLSGYRSTCLVGAVAGINDDMMYSRLFSDETVPNLLLKPICQWNVLNALAEHPAKVEKSLWYNISVRLHSPTIK
jgi:hypothetical protein